MLERNHIACVVAPLLLLFVPLAPLRASVIVSGPLTYEHEATPGTSYTGTIELSNPGKDAEEVRIYQTDYLFYSDGRSIYGEIGKSLKVGAMRFGTDAGYAWNPNSPRPAVLETMGLLGSKIHSSGEYAELDSIVPRLYLSVRMIQTLCETK